MTENLKVETDNQAKASDIAQSEKDSSIVAKEPVAEDKNKVNLPGTVEEFEKALQSASSKKMNEFLKKFDATKLSDIEERLAKIPDYEKQVNEFNGKSKSYEDKIAEMQRIIDEQKPIIQEKARNEFLTKNNIKTEFADDFFTLYEKRVKEDKSNEEEVIKDILTRHPDMSSVQLNNVKTSVKNSDKKDVDDGLNRIRKAIGLPLKK